MSGRVRRLGRAAHWNSEYLEVRDAGGRKWDTLTRVVRRREQREAAHEIDDNLDLGYLDDPWEDYAPGYDSLPDLDEELEVPDDGPLVPPHLAHLFPNWPSA